MLEEAQPAGRWAARQGQGQGQGLVLLQPGPLPRHTGDLHGAETAMPTHQHGCKYKICTLSFIKNLMRRLMPWREAVLSAAMSSAQALHAHLPASRLPRHPRPFVQLPRGLPRASF